MKRKTQKTKRGIMWILLCTTAVIGCLLCGCSKEEQSSAENDSLTLTYWHSIDGGANTLQYIKSYAENTALQELEKRTGVHIEWIHPAVGQENEQFNLMIASKQIPDMVGNAEWYRGGPGTAIKDGLFLDITDMLKTYAPNLSSLIEQYPILKKQMYSEDGTFLGFCCITDDQFGTEIGVSAESPYAGPMIRKDYLDELGLGIPETIDEWYTTLKMIKETKNPNIVLAMPNKGVNELIGTFLAAYGIAPEFYQVDGEMKYGRIEDGYRSYLETMHKWYEEGLIDSEFATRDQQSLNSQMDSGQVAAIHQQSPSFILRQKSLNQEWTGTPYPRLDKNTPNPWRYSRFAAMGEYTIISADSKYPEECIQWLDYCYSLDGMRLLNFGIDGVDYFGLDENGCPIYSEKYVTADGDSSEWTAKRDVFRLHSGSFLKSDKRSNPNRWINELESWRENWASTPSLYELPPVILSVDETTELSNVMNDIKTYVNEMTVKFIIGTEPLSGYEEYVSNIRKMGIDDALEIYQNALDRYNGK